jgi:glycosyltransferase involved in cell wall biosynthesis
MKISCVIHTHNSSSFIESVIKSVLWCDEVVVIDMESTDNTVDLVKHLGAVVYSHKNIGYADPARSFGLSKCSHDWILAIDSDEIVPPKLSQQLREISKNERTDLVYLSFRNFFFGKELQGTGWSYKNIFVPRFFKRGFLEYRQEVHNFIHIKNNPRVLKLIEHDLAIIHFNYLDIHHFIYKLNNYTDFEAEKNIYNQSPLFFFPYHFLREFFGRFFILRGYRDGWVGFYLSFAMVFYRWTSFMKAKSPGKNKIVQIYNEIAKKTLVEIGTNQK